MRHLRYFDDTLNQALTCTIGRVSLTCKYELYRIFRIVDNLRKAVEVGEVSTLVSSETTSETNHKGIRIDAFENFNHASGVTLVLNPVLTEVALDEVDKLVLHLLAHSPNFFIGHAEDRRPCGFLVLCIVEVLAEVLFVVFLPFRSSPSRHVNAFGNIRNMRFFRSITLPNALEHLLRYFAVQPANAVRFLASIQSEYAHRELFVSVGVLTPHVHKVLPRDTELVREFAHIFAEEAFFEVVVTCRHRSVHCIERSGANHFEGFVEVEMFFVNIVNKALQVKKSSVTFVAVVELVLDAEALEHKHATNTKHIFLFDAVFPVTTI